MLSTAPVGSFGPVEEAVVESCLTVSGGRESLLAMAVVLWLSVGCWTVGSLAVELSVGCGLDGDSSPLGSGVCLGK